MKSKSRKPQISFEASTEFKNELNQVAEKIEIPAAQICREAVREKIAHIRATHPSYKKQPDFTVSQ